VAAHGHGRCLQSLARPRRAAVVSKGSVISSDSNEAARINGINALRLWLSFKNAQVASAASAQMSFTRASELVKSAYTRGKSREL